MKPILRFPAFVLLAGVLFTISCQKEIPCQNCQSNPPGSTNKSPVANAGPDQITMLPKDSVSLDGSTSNDPDGTIASYSWSKISGPASIQFRNAASSSTMVTNLLPGIYLVELKVTDNKAAIGRDTIQISVVQPSAGNRPPVAIAGPDQIWTAPVSSALLDGIASTDPDNNIVSYQWTRITGPTTFLITVVSPSKVQVTFLDPGVHQFELRVTDAGGLFSLDTILVTITTTSPPTCGAGRTEINAQLIPFGNLSVPRILVTIAAAGNKILFAGGQFDNGAEFQTTDLVDIYDVTTNTWSTAQMNIPRYSMETITAGNKIYFAGGRSNWLGPLGWDQFKIVDIYDASNNTWSTAQLSTSRTALSVEKVGDKLLFAGGRNEYPGTFLSNVVDVLDLNTNTWTTTNLSVGRSDMSSVVVGNKAYFAGGNLDVGPINGTHNPSTRIDIYDYTSGTWSSSSLNEPRANFAGIEYSGNIFWAGSENSTATALTKSSTVQVWDPGSGQSTINCLFQPNSWFDATINNSRVLFFTGGGAWSVGGPDHTRFDIYTPSTNTWSIGKLDRSLSHTGILTINNITYIAGGFNIIGATDQVWKLQF